MDTWFLFALAAAVVGGVGAFTHKVAAHRNYDISVLNIYASSISASIVGIGAWYHSRFEQLWELSVLIAFVASFSYFITLVLKVGALRHIDAAVFFPLYKVLGPFISIVLSIVIFSETFTVYQWIGLVCSLGVPLLLITKAENKRQKNLKFGLIFLVLASLIGTISIAFTKYGADITSSVWMFVFVGEVFLALSSIFVLAQQHGRGAIQFVVRNTPAGARTFILIMATAQALSALTMVFAFSAGGSLAIVYTISSLYILIPILLSVYVYKEHFNLQKGGALALAVAALALLK
jgi:drug/metabolite transporter (DMT)-like permease